MTVESTPPLMATKTRVPGGGEDHRDSSVGVVAVLRGRCSVEAACVFHDLVILPRAMVQDMKVTMIDEGEKEATAPSPLSFLPFCTSLQHCLHLEWSHQHRQHHQYHQQP